MNNSNFDNGQSFGENRAKELNDSLFAPPSPMPESPAQVKAKKNGSFNFKELWLNISITLLTLIIAFTGAFLGIYYVCNTALFGDSEFAEAFLAKYAGIDEYKVEVDSISGEYVGNKIELSEKVLNTTVCIRVVSDVNGIYSTSVSGSGFILEYFEDTGVTYAVTNHHVIYGAEEFFVETYDGKRYEGEIMHLDEISDLALVKFVSDTKLPTVTVADSSKAKAGQDIVAAGNPRGLGFSVSFGYVSHPNRDNGNSDGNLIQMDISVNPGNSGGGLYDAQGNLLGVVVSKEVGENVDGIGYAIPSNRMLTVVSDLLKHGYVKGRAALGISAYTVTAGNYDALATGELSGFLPAVNRKYGLYVESSSRSTEVKKGDRIVSADGILISTIYDLRNVLARHTPYSTVDIKVERLVEGTLSNPQYEQIEVKILLGERDWPDENN